jgi:hypothetical protein
MVFELTPNALESFLAPGISPLNSPEEMLWRRYSINCSATDKARNGLIGKTTTY